MPAVASTIFKIRAHSDLIAKPDASLDVLSFRKGQPFYALSADYENGLYFVSTQFAVPFSRTAVSGLVPIEYFDKVDLLSKDPPIHRKKVVAAPKPAAASNSTAAAPSIARSNTLPPVPKRKQSLNPAEQFIADTNPPNISSIKVMSISNESKTGSESFCIRITRRPSIHNTSAAPQPACTYIINRTIPDFIALAAAAGQVFKKINAENYPLSLPSRDSKIKALEIYLARLVLVLIPSLQNEKSASATNLVNASALFFNPKADHYEEIVGQTTVLRRDSGADTESEETGEKHASHVSKSQNPFASFSKMVFGVSSN